MADKSNKELLDELGVEVIEQSNNSLSPKEERVIAGFEEIQRFVEDNGRMPTHGEDKDIFERIYATRLDRIRSDNDLKEIVKPLDHQGLLSISGNFVAEPSTKYGSDKEILEELGVTLAKDQDITVLKHVKPRAEIKAAEEIATRKKCADFVIFKPTFEAIQNELKSGLRVTKPFKDNAEINKGDLFILGGQKLIVADVGEEFITDYDRKDCRLRVIYDNGTESDILRRSLQRALNKDENGRRISKSDFGPLFSSITDDQDISSGTIYVLRSKSDHPTISENRDLIHKIGVTGGNVKTRIANAKSDPTFLLADVEIVATYELFNINRTKLENILHRFFEPAKLDIDINDRFGNKVTPREWFLVPLFIVDQVVDKIKDGSISQFKYDPKKATITEI